MPGGGAPAPPTSSRPSGERRSTWIERLPLFRPAQNSDFPDGASGHRLASRPPPIWSKRITSAPSWASVIPPSGAATNAEPSITRRSASGWCAHGRTPTKRQSSTCSARSTAVTCERRWTSAAVAPLDLEARAQRVALEHRAGVVGRVPAEDRDEAGRRPRGLIGGERDRVAAVDEPLPVRGARGVEVRHRDVERHARERGRGVHDVTAVQVALASPRGPGRRASRGRSPRRRPAARRPRGRRRRPPRRPPRRSARRAAGASGSA